MLKPPLNWDKVFTYKSERYNNKFKTSDIIKQEEFEVENRLKEIATKIRKRLPLNT